MWLTLGGAVLVVVAAWIATWLGVIVFLLLVAGRSGRSAAACGSGRRRRTSCATRGRRAGSSSSRTRPSAAASSATCSGSKAEGVDEDVLARLPALNSRLRTWTSDEDGARAAAQARLDASLARLAARGVNARGEIGDGDPLQALEDALREFPADEIVVSTHPPGRSHWLEQGVVEQRADALRRAGDARRRRPRGDHALDAAARGGRAYLPAMLGDVLRDRLDLRVAELPLERGHPALAVRDAVDRERRATASPRRGSGRRFRSRRRRPACGSRRSRPSAKIALPSARAALGRRRLRRVRGVVRLALASSPATLRDVSRDVVRVLALEDVRGHPRRARRGVDDRIGDLAAHDLDERALAEPVAARLEERVVEVRADLARSCRRRRACGS